MPRGLYYVLLALISFLFLLNKLWAKRNQNLLNRCSPNVHHYSRYLVVKRRFDPFFRWLEGRCHVYTPPHWGTGLGKTIRGTIVSFCVEYDFARWARGAQPTQPPLSVEVGEAPYDCPVCQFVNPALYTTVCGYWTVQRWTHVIMITADVTSIVSIRTAQPRVTVSTATRSLMTRSLVEVDTQSYMVLSFSLY